MTVQGIASDGSGAEKFQFGPEWWSDHPTEQHAASVENNNNENENNNNTIRSRN